MTLKALKTRVLFTKEQAETTTASGIVLTQPEDNPNPFGLVTDVGPAVVHQIAVGDRIVVNWQYVSQMDHEGARYYVVDQANILAIVEENS